MQQATSLGQEVLCIVRTFGLQSYMTDSPADLLQMVSFLSGPLAQSGNNAAAPDMQHRVARY